MKKKLWIEQSSFGAVCVHTKEPMKFSGDEWFPSCFGFRTFKICQGGFERWLGRKVPEPPGLLEIEVTVKIGPTWEPVE